MDFVYRPKWTDKKTGEIKTSPTWWVCYSVDGQRIRESSRSTNRADAVRLLKHRNGKSAATRERGIQPIRPADEHPSGVYFVRCGDYVKIGYAERPSARTVELQTGNPVQLEIAHVVAGDPPLERWLCRAILVIHVPRLRERYAELVAVRA